MLGSAVSIRISLEVLRARVNDPRGAGMAGMDDAFAQAEVCRRLASELRTTAMATTSVPEQQATQELARHYDALANSWLQVAQTRKKLK